MGTPGILNVRVVSTIRVAELGATVLVGEALCGSSEVVLGGGFTIAKEGRQSTEVIQSAPLDSADAELRGWNTTIVLDSAAGGKGKRGASLTTFAICAEVSQR